MMTKEDNHDFHPTDRNIIKMLENNFWIRNRLGIVIMIRNLQCYIEAIIMLLSKKKHPCIIHDSLQLCW